MATLNNKLEIYRQWKDSLILGGQDFYDYFDTVQSYIDFADYYYKKITEVKMTNKQQTAVEWLHLKLSTSSSEEMVGNINIWFKQAKEMEKERMIEFAWECQEMFKHEIKEHFEEKFNDGGNK
jgi:hypothetical protein